MVYETQHRILKGEQNEPPPKTWMNPNMWRYRRKTKQSTNQVLSKLNIPAPYYTGSVYVAHGRGDDDYFLAVSLWMFCLRYCVIIFVFDMQWIVALLHGSV